MNIRFFLFFIIIGFCFTGFAQKDPIWQSNRSAIENWSGEYVRVGAYKVKGSPMLFARALKGTLVYDSTAPVRSSSILYDLLNQRVGPGEGSEIFEVDQKLIEFMVYFPEEYGGEIALFRNGDIYEPNLSKPKYYKILAQGSQVHFLKFYDAKLMSDPSDPMTKDKKIFDIQSSYFIYGVKSGKIEKLKLTERDLKKTLESLGVKIDSFNMGLIEDGKEKGYVKLIESINNNQ